jgi:branched-chain amino acid transport system substrate-binding protein
MVNRPDTGGESSRRSFLTNAGLGASAAALLAGLNQGAQAQSADPVIVGCPMPLTGVVAADGIEFRRGIEMSAKEINALGGILGRPIELRFADTESKGDDVITAAGQRLIDKDNACVLISGYNVGTQTALQNVVAGASLIYLHADTARAHIDMVSKDPEKYWGSFMYCPSEIFYGYSYLDLVKRLEDSGQLKLPNRKIALITGPITYSINIAKAIESKAKDYGLEVSLYETVQAPISEWGPTLAKLRANPPGLIVITHFFPQDQAQFMIQFMTNPTNSMIYMQYGASLAAFRDIAGEASKGVIYAISEGVLGDEIGNDFTRKYLAAYGANASVNSGDQTYAALQMYAIAASLAGGPGKPYDDAQNRKIAARLKSLIYRGVQGVLRFDPKNQSVITYPFQTKDPSLGVPHLFSQIKKKEENGYIFSPAPFDVAKFEKPSWMK